MVETAKRIMTKEKLDKQLTGQTSTSSFMYVRDGTERKRKVSFNARDELGDKIDKLTVMMSRLAAKVAMRKDPSNPKYIRVEVRTVPIIREVIRIEVVDQIVETEDSRETIDLDKTIETIIFQGTLEDMEEKIIGENTEVVGTLNITEAEIGQEKGCSKGIMVTIGIEVPVIVDQDQDLELVLTRIE